jgi:hypothetical protein
MPLAAWCSRCGMYQWVSADGRCVRGHSAENLSNAHEVPYEGYPSGPVPTRLSAREDAAVTVQAPLVQPLSPEQRRLIYLPVAAVVLATIAVALFVFNLSTVYPRGLGAPAKIVPPSETVGSGAPRASATPGAPASGAASTTAPRHVAVSKEPNLASPSLDSFIAWQYPGYTVAKRVSFPGQYKPGRLGVNYLLVNKREPRFLLLVGLTELKAGESTDAAGNAYVAEVGRVMSTDAVFSVQATRFGPSLSTAGQDALVKAIADKNPAPDAVYGLATSGAFSVSAIAEVGPGAAEFLMQDSTASAAYRVQVALPEDAASGSIDVKITKN